MHAYMWRDFLLSSHLDQFLLAFSCVSFAGVAGVDEKPSCSLLLLLSPLTLGLPLSAPSPMESLLRAFRASVQYFLLVSSSDDTPHRRLCKSSRILFFSPRGSDESPLMAFSLSSLMTSRSVVVVILRLWERERERGEGASAPGRGVACCAAGAGTGVGHPLNPQTAGFALQGKNTMSPQALGVISSASASILIRCISCMGTLSLSSLGVHRRSSSWLLRVLTRLGCLPEVENSVASAAGWRDLSLEKLVARPTKISSKRLDVTRSNEPDPIARWSGEEDEEGTVLLCTEKKDDVWVSQSLALP